MFWLDLLKTIIYGIVEGITEWLPISSTGHLILLEKWLPLSLGDAFFSVFLVVIQLGAILAVVVLYWKKLWPFGRRIDVYGRRGGITVKKGTIELWAKILVACIPAAAVGLLFDDWIEATFYHYVTVAVMLIVVGILFLVVEYINKSRRPKILMLDGITWRIAFLIGIFQLAAAVFPGTSRSGATILGGLLLGLSRKNAAEFTFFLAVPVMFGASLLKLVKSSFPFSFDAVFILLVGTVVAFVVSLLAIRFLLGFIKKNDFKPFAVYRIVLGVVVLILGIAFGL